MGERVSFSSFNSTIGTLVPFLESSETPLYKGSLEHLFRLIGTLVPFVPFCSNGIEYWLPLCFFPASERFLLIVSARWLSASISFFRIANASPAVAFSSVSVPDKPYSMIASYTSSLTCAGSPLMTFFQPS